MNCWWCHNPESRDLPSDKIKETKFNCLRPYSIQVGEGKVREVSVRELIIEIKKDIIFFEQSQGGVTFSGGEPLVQLEFLYSILTECKKENIHTVVDTCGYAPREDFKKIYELVDLFLYDIKVIDDKAHVDSTGVSNKLILENLAYLNQLRSNIFIRIPLIPGVTDTEENLIGIAEYVKKLKTIKRIDLLPYNPMGEEKYKKLKMDRKLPNLKHQTEAELDKIRKKLENYGFEVKVGG